MKKYFFLIESMTDFIVGRRRNKYKLKSEGVN